jgi:hypothetical protein
LCTILAEIKGTFLVLKNELKKTKVVSFVIKKSLFHA